ncbi:MAG TPA: hypothetical protein DD414_03595, partial [Lachnospiraceae bacterium]|nr:hypothetical protein [Lachnospiraceae bacterium]
KISDPTIYLLYPMFKTLSSDHCPVRSQHYEFSKNHMPNKQKRMDVLQSFHLTVPNYSKLGILQTASCTVPFPEFDKKPKVSPSAPDGYAQKNNG